MLLLFMLQNMWLNFGKPTEMSHLANFTFLAQLIATLIHYPCTVAIPGLAAWSAFLERIFPTMWSHDRLLWRLNSSLLRHLSSALLFNKLLMHLFRPPPYLISVHRIRLGIMYSVLSRCTRVSHWYSATHTALLLCRILLVLISKEGLGPWHTTVLFISCYS